MRKPPDIPRVELLTFVKNILFIADKEYPDIEIIEQADSKGLDKNPRIVALLRMINNSYHLWTNNPSLQSVNQSKLVSAYSPVVHGWRVQSYDAYQNVVKTPAPLRTAQDITPAGCLQSSSKIQEFLQSWFSKLHQLESIGSPEEKAAFAWLTPYRWTFAAPWAHANFVAGLGIFFYLRVHWDMSFFSYPLTRAEVAETQLKYSIYWVQNGLWSEPPFPPVYTEKKEKLIGTE